MLTKLLLQDETTASLGKTEHDFIVDVSGEKFDPCESICQLVIQEVEEHS